MGPNPFRIIAFLCGGPGPLKNLHHSPEMMAPREQVLAWGAPSCKHVDFSSASWLPLWRRPARSQGVRNSSLELPISTPPSLDSRCTGRRSGQLLRRRGSAQRPDFESARYGHGRCCRGTLECRPHRRCHPHGFRLAQRRRERRQRHRRQPGFAHLLTSRPQPPAIRSPSSYDADGSVINSLFGAGSSDPTSCQNNGVFTWLDNIQPDATIAHAVILLNGLCATSPNLVAMMQIRTGTSLRPRPGPRLRAGQSRRPHQRRTRWPAGLARHAADERHLRSNGRHLHSQSRSTSLRRYRRPQPHLPDHRSKPCLVSRQADHRREHRLDPGNASAFVPGSACRASTLLRGRSTRTAIRFTSTRVTVRLGRVLQRQPRQSHHRLDRLKWKPARAVGLKRSRPCRASSISAVFPCHPA